MANKITLIRIVSLPLLVWFLARQGILWAVLGLLTFVLLAITDWLDGYVARNHGQVTRTGKLLDPIADKLLIMTALLPLIGRGEVPAWLGILILGREFLVNGLRMIAAADHVIIAAGTWGKYKTIFYIVGLSIIIVAPAFGPWAEPLRIPGLVTLLRDLGLATLLAGVILSLVSAGEYFRHFNPSDTPPSA
jgi:CDP-diacylglycerol---glycerol-3-phosphate 3-phosphatidyltransferase